VPCIEFSDARVDLNVLSVSMPTRLIRQLDLMPIGIRTERTSAGFVPHQVCGAVRLAVQRRDCATDVVEVPNDDPVLIRRLPVQLLDFVIDSSGQCLIGNPAHGGQRMIEMYQMSISF
jgi:hypothetical protein